MIKVNDKYIKLIQRYEFNIDNIKVGDAIRIENIQTQDVMNMIVCDMLYDLSYNSSGRSFEVYNQFKSIDDKSKIHTFGVDEFAGEKPVYKLEVLR